MHEFKGQLIGGPDDGNHVIVMRNRIPVVNTTDMWLEGDGEESTVTMVVTKGEYIWDNSVQGFIWKADTVSVFSKKMEAV